MLYPLFGTTVLPGGAETIYMIPAFFLGSLLAYYKEKIEMSIFLPVSLIIIAEITITNVVFSNLFMILGVSLAFIWFSSLRIIRKFKLSHDISYGVYLWGWPIEQLVGYFFPNSGYYCFVISSLFITFIIAYISCRLVEEPALAFERKLLKIFFKG